MDKFRRYWWFGLCFWVLVAFVSWHYESSCGVFFYPSCFSQYWSGVRWIALLKWVEPYQTLLAGLAALAAGKFALTAARHSTETSIKLENSKSRQASLIACSIVADEFRDATNVLDRVVGAGVYVKTPESPFIQSQTYMASLHSINPMLGSIVSAQKRDIEHSILSGGNTGRYHHINEMKAKSYVVWHMLLMISERLDEAGKYDLNNSEKLPAGPLKRNLNELGIPPARLIGLYSLFDWSKTRPPSH